MPVRQRLMKVQAASSATAATVRSGYWRHFVSVDVAGGREPSRGSRQILERVGKILKRMAGTTGLEPATSDVTGRRSNQLNYVPAFSGRDFIVARQRARN